MYFARVNLTVNHSLCFKMYLVTWQGHLHLNKQCWISLLLPYQNLWNNSICIFDTKKFVLISNIRIASRKLHTFLLTALPFHEYALNPYVILCNIFIILLTFRLNSFPSISLMYYWACAVCCYVESIKW